MFFQFDDELLSLTPEEVATRYAGRRLPEAVKMYLAIQTGSKMESGEGWFGPAQSRYDWRWLLQRATGGDSSSQSITLAEFHGPQAWFERLDRNRDGCITADDLDWSESNPWVEHAYLVNRLFRKLNTSGDGRLTRAQWDAFFDTAAAGRDHVTSNDLRDQWLTGMTASFLPGDAPTREQLLRGFFAGEVGSMCEGPDLGATAPDFTLAAVDGRSKIRLSDYFTKSKTAADDRKPVVLVFGNFTCGPFRSMYAGVEEVHRRFGDQAHFLLIYVREAHPTDGWAMQSNESAGVSVEQPKTIGARVEVARQCHARLKPSIPLLVDDIDDSVGHAYSGMPARLYVIDRRGRVAYKGGRGPFGFKTGEMEQTLVMTLLDQADEPRPRCRLLDVDEAWKRIAPESSLRASAALPIWAQALAETLPGVVAHMLRLDFLIRTTDQLSEMEKGLLRVATARANRSAYGADYAREALIRAGCEPATVNSLLVGDDSPLDDRSRRLVQFAEQLARAGRDVSNEQVASLLEAYGDARAVAVVLSVAYGAFQDRLVQALALPLEPHGPVAPIDIAPPDLTSVGKSTSPVRPPIPAWASESALERPARVSPYEPLQARLEQQRGRESRIRIPEWSEVSSVIPPGLYSATRPLEIRWSRLVVGRQPEIGGAWIKTLRAFAAESGQDRVFEESMFWIVTRALQCGYCMGHCEMLMEVGGLNSAEIAARTQALASGAWEKFSPAERIAFGLAEKMTDAPWSITDDDVSRLTNALGNERGLDAVWWIARCQFMTKISDAFQLSLERENVFLNAYS